MQVGDDLIGHLSTMPQPVALGLGRIVRASGAVERLEACLKAAEVIARHLAVVGLGSAAATRDPADPPLQIEGLSGNLSFGTFDTAARVVCNTSWDHPLRNMFRTCFRSTRKIKSIAGPSVDALIQLRNRLGHSLTPADEHRARAILAEEDPIGKLIELMNGVRPILELPLVVALAQEARRGQIVARLSFYVGEGEPIPRQVILNAAIFEWESPYLCTSDGLVPLTPGLILRPQNDGRLGLFLLDAITKDGARYKSVLDNAVAETDRTLFDLSRWIELPFSIQESQSPGCPLIERVGAADGRSLLAYVRNEPIPEPKLEEPKNGTLNGASNPLPQKPLSARAFEEQANISGFGMAYRDVTYFLLEQGHRIEVGDVGIRIVTESDAARVLLTAQLRAGPELELSVFPGAVQGGTEEEPLKFTLRPEEAADHVLARLSELIKAASG